MPTRSFIKSVSTGAMLFSSVAMALPSAARLFEPLPARATCSCSSRADCTCKKGACKCPKCGQHQNAVRIYESFKPQDARLPNTARLEATGGAFL